MRHPIVWSLILAALGLLPLALRADESANLVSNPGFEDAPSAPAGFSLFIPADSQGANCRFTISSDTFHSGKQSALMQSDDFARFCLSPNLTYPVVAGDRCRIGAWVKAGADFQMDPGSPGLVIRLNQTASSPPTTTFTFVYLDGTASEPGTPDASPEPKTAATPAQWTHIEAVVKVPPGADHLVPTLFYWKARGSLYVDDFSLEKVNPTSPLAPPASSGSTNSTTSANAPAASVSAPPRWLVKPDHENGIYGPNEKVTWTVDFTGDRTGLPALAYVVKEDGQVEVGKGTVDVSAGPTTITTSRSTPGVLVAQIYPAAKSSGYAVAAGGAVISPDQINLSTPVPADFDAFWQSKLKQLAAVPVNPVMETVDIGAIKFTGSIDFYKVTLDNINGAHVYGQMARPKDGKKFPAMLIVQSAGVYPLDKTPVIANAKAGWLVLNIIAHDLPIDEPPDFYNKLKATTLKDYQFIGCDDRDKSYFLRMFLGCVRAVDYLTSRPDWNGRVLLVTGGSQGGFQSFATAALCPQITDVAVSVPAGCDLLAPLATPPRAFGWPYWTSYWVPRELDKKKIQETAGYYDGINFAVRIHCPTLACVGLIDDTARPTGVIAACNAIKAPKELLVLPLSDHHGTGNAQGAYYQEFNIWRNDLRDGKPLPTTNAK
ncbi:MAG TPA: acetylxylan esterase [Candidatus Methylacidiphilales bacterium]